MKAKKKLIALIALVIVLLAALGTILFFSLKDKDKNNDQDKDVVQETGTEYTVTFYNEGEVYDTVKVLEGTRVKLPEEPESEDDTIGFVGWTQIDGDVEEIVDFSQVGIVSDCTVYALWMDVHEVVINADNGAPFESLKLFSGELIEKPEDPVKEGYRFVEWRNMETTAAFDFEKPVYSSFTLKAVYGDGAANRVSETKWDFSKGVGSWKADQGAWGHVEEGTALATLTEERVNAEGYAGWYYGGLDDTEEGYALKIFGNEGVSVSAQKAKIVVMYIKSTDNPIDSFRISILTNLGGSIFNYGGEASAWAIKSDSLNKELCQIDEMSDGWTRVQFKISELSVWSEEAVLSAFSFGIVQAPLDPKVDTLYLKSIELLDQEEFIDPKVEQKVIQTSWDMTNRTDSAMWYSAQNQTVTSTINTSVNENGTSYVYKHTNAWKGILLENAAIPIGDTKNVLSVTYKTEDLKVTAYRIYVVTNKGGSPTNNALEDRNSYYATIDPRDIKQGTGWTYKVNEDGTTTVTYDLTKLDYWKNGKTLKALTFTIVDGSATGTITYKTISLNGTQNPEDVWKPSGALVTQTSWDMSKETDSAMWYSVQNKTVTNTVTTQVLSEGTRYTYSHVNAWKGIVLENADIDISKLSGKLSVTYSTSLNITNYRISILTDAGGSITNVGQSDKDSYYNIVSVSNLVGGWSVTQNSDGTTTVTYDLNRLEYWKNGTELRGLHFVAQDSTATGNITYKSIVLETGSASDVTKVTQTAWNMADATDSAMWYSAQNKTYTNVVTTEVLTEGTKYTYTAGNAWKGVILEGAEIDITEKNSIFSVTYQSDLKVQNYRVYILTESGGALTTEENNGNYYATIAVNDIAEGTGWTRTENADGSITVTYDLSKLAYWKVGTKLKGLTFVTVASGTGDMTYQTIQLTEAAEQETPEENAQVIWDMSNATDSAMWYSAQNKTATNVVTTEVLAEGTKYTYAHANAWKGIILKDVEIGITEANNIFSVTYQSDLEVRNYRVYILTESGGALTAEENNGNHYATIEVSAIAEGTGWTRTENADGSITVTYDLSKLAYWKVGTKLEGMTFVAQDSGKTGSITYQTIQLTEAAEQETPEENAQVIWDMSNATDSAMWYSAQNKTATNVVTTEVLAEGTKYTYAHANAWKGIILKDVEIGITEANNIFSVTYQSDLEVRNYRVYILTESGGALTAEENNGNHYATIAVSDIAEETGWTRTKNADGSITVTYDLSKLAYWKVGTKLKGITFVAQDSGKTGSITYQSISLEQSQVSTFAGSFRSVMYAIIPESSTVTLKNEE